MCGQLGDGRAASELGGQLLERLIDRPMGFLQPSRNVEYPGAIAKVPTDLAEDRRRCEACEVHAARRIEPVDRFDQPDGADLDQVVERLAATGISPGERLDQRHEF